jgi:hypothetical protein
MRTFKFLARPLVLLAAMQSFDVCGEYYVVQQGDVLWSIANKKISNSDLPFNLEQVMLTIFKLNPDVFIDGDVDRVLPGKRIYIPDNVADFVQLSRSEAQHLLRDRNYLRGLYSSSSKLKLMSTPGQKGSAAMQDYGQILQTLENHQQNIDILKIENAHLSKSFKLLERALGRIVVVQGLLTNDVVKVKSRLFNGQANVAVVPEVDAPEKEATTLVDNAPVSLPKIEENIAKPEVNAGALVGEVNQLSATSNQDNLAVSNPQADSAPLDENGSAIKSIDLNPTKVVKEAPGENLPQNQVKSSDASADNGFWMDIAMIAAVLGSLLLLLLWVLDFRKIRTKLMPSKTTADIIATAPKFSIKDRLVPNQDSNRYTVNIPSIDDLSHDEEPIKIKTDKSIKDNSSVDRNAELSGVMELLDMCLLFGDYQQAHSLTLKALSDFKSPMLSKKLAFIERKLAKY